ncbi:MAG: threonine ammonia-lyase [Candidatus Helarchaeota archaeon]
MKQHIKEIQEANKRIGYFCRKTPLIYSTTFSNMVNNEVYLKLENFQKTGSFKIRGAMNKILQLNKDEVKNGIITASAGNHGQAVALAAKLQGYNCNVVVPVNTPLNKIMAIESYGAKIITAGITYDEAFNHAMQIKEENNLTFIQAYNDFDIIYGQGTIGLEILEQMPKTDIVVVPVGGGGLISGIAAYCKGINPDIKIIGVQSESFNSMYHSFEKHKLIHLEPNGLTIADGIAVKKPGNLTFNIIKENVDKIVQVNDDQIANAILMLMERAKIVVEGAGAVGLAAILYNKYFKAIKNKKIAVIISGGNIDVNLLNRIIIRGLKESGRLLKFSTKLLDTPGSLLKLLEIIKNNNANIISINHNRNKLDVPFKEAEVEIEIETRNSSHIKNILKSLKKYNTKILE